MGFGRVLGLAVILLPEPLLAWWPGQVVLAAKPTILPAQRRSFFDAKRLDGLQATI